MAAAETTPTHFEWPAGPSSVQVSGDWDQWKDKVDLDKQADGSFSGKIPLPSNSKVHYKYIVDGGWTTNPSSPIVDDSGNQNNVVDVGPAPTAVEAATTKATEIGAGVAAGAAAAAAAATAAATKFVDQVNGTEGKADETEQKEELTAAEKKEDPAAGLKKSADDDIRNQVPTSISSASHGAMPVLASAVATVTGADVMRGNPESLPVSQKEINDTQAEAMKGDNSYVGARTEAPGGAISDPAAATTENSKAAAMVANNATVGGPAVPVSNNGFAANVTGATGNLTTAADQAKEGGAKAGAVAAASAGAAGATVVGGAAAIAKSNGKKETETKAAPAAAPSAPAAKKEPVASSAPIAALPGVTSTSSKGKDAPKPATQLPSTTGPASSKAQADKANAPAAATSSAPLAAGKETTTPAAVADKSLPVTPKKSSKEKPTAAAIKTDTIREKGSQASAVKGNNASAAAPTSSAPATASKTPESSSTPATPDKKKKTGLFGKIKQALSPHGSPGK